VAPYDPKTDGPHSADNAWPPLPGNVWRTIGRKLTTLTRLLESVLVIPLTTNMDRARLAGTAIISSSDDRSTSDSVALAFQMRAIPKRCLTKFVRPLSVEELAELDLATDEALGRAEPTAEPEK
jgi:mRNA-degrading endonuclease toxin of MazEF toxin-antitoxin module